MKRDDFRLLHRLRVRWAEVDMQKIVFNGHYLMYFDTAMADYWRALALPYEATMHSFIQMGRAIPEALTAHNDAARALRHAFEN